MRETQPWIACQERLPPEGLVVQTRIDDSRGVRNTQELKRRGRLWFVPDGSIYVYYEPTHWKSAEADT
jgi:hypothetical protein